MLIAPLVAEEDLKFPWLVDVLWVAGSAIMNWYGAGFLGMVINTPTINYFTHGTQLIMPHGHAAMFGAFGSKLILSLMAWLF